jgi:hypothetical protein
MTEPPIREFGRRRPPVLDPGPPAKRSGHVALLVMGTLAVGGSAFALMPRENCEPNGPGMAAPSLPQTGAACAPRSGSGHVGSGGSWSRSSFFGGDPAASGSSSGGASDSAESGVTRGGFGGFARAFAAHFSGGG